MLSMLWMLSFKSYILSIVHHSLKSTIFALNFQLANNICLKLMYRCNIPKPQGNKLLNMVSRIVIDFGFTICLCAIGTIICTIMLLTAIKKIRHQNNEIISKTFKILYLSVLTICILLLFSVFMNQTIFTILNAMSIKYDRHDALIFCRIHHNYQMFLLISFETCVLNYFATRLNNLFSHPKMMRYRFNPPWIITIYQIIIVICGIITWICLWISIQPVLLNFTTDPPSLDLEDKPKNWTHCNSIDDQHGFSFRMVLTVYCFFIYAMNLVVWCLFINRFYVIVKDQLRGTINHTNTDDEEDSLPIIHVMKKQTLLVGIATTSTIILWLITFNVPWVITVFITDWFITSFCIFLSFGSFEKYYQMIGCHICERRCCKCIDNVINAKLSMHRMGSEIAVEVETI